MKNKFFEYDKNISDFVGLWYQINDLTIRFTNEFYDKDTACLSVVLNYLNKEFSTDKFEAYIKKRISEQIFIVLEILYLAKNLGRESTLVINDDKINRYLIGKFNRQYPHCTKISFYNNFTNLFLIFYYWAWLIKELAKRGFTFIKKQPYFKLAVESRSGFHRKVNRDDIFVDGRHFTKDDVLFCKFTNNNIIKNRAFNIAREKGFHGVSVDNLAFNLNHDFGKILNLYFFTPLFLYAKLLLTQQSYLLYNLLYFFKRILPLEALLRRYRIGCKVSVVDHDDIAETIILNKYGAKNIIYNWSDLTTYRDHNYAFIAHNIYFVWGDIHYDYHADNYFVDKKINIGCIFKNEYNKALSSKEQTISRIPNIMKGKKIVAFFDTSFSAGFLFTQSSILEYLAIINEFCEKNQEINVLLKAKNEESYAEMISGRPDYYRRFEKIWSQLNNHANFHYLSPLQWGIEEIIAVSDVSVNMGLNSPSTIALICGRDALYFNLDSNDCHPFAKKYKDIIVLDKKELLFRQIENILSGKFRCKDVISEQEVRQYDAFSDDNALERLKDNLYELTLQ